MPPFSPPFSSGRRRRFFNFISIATTIRSRRIFIATRSRFSLFSRSPFIDFGAADRVSTGEFFGICLLPALPNVVHQVTQVVSLNYMGPGVYAVFIRSSVIMTALLALIFFPEERWIIRQWQFQIGTLLGLFGAVGVFWFQPRWTAGHVSLGGLAIAFTASFCWALYGVLVKRPSAQLGSIRSFGVISFLTSVMLFPLTWIFGKIDTPLHAGAHVNWILVVSAVLCITLAHVLYYVAIRELGVALSQTLQLLSPLGALALSAWIFHERLSVAQLWCAAILLFGAFIATRIKPVAVIESAEMI